MKIPLWVEASRLRVLIFGGGSVGTRRAKFFASAGAKVRVVARQFTNELLNLGVETVEADLYKYDPSGDIEWADLVVISVNDQQLAQKLFQLASSMGKLVNDATDASRTHVVVPYERMFSGLRIAVTSEGAAGTPARLSLEVIEECLKNSWIPHLYVVYSELKKEAKAHVSDTSARLQFYQSLWEDPQFREYIQRGDVQLALERGREILKLYR